MSSPARGVAGDGTSPARRACGGWHGWLAQPCCLCAFVVAGLALAWPIGCRPPAKEPNGQPGPLTLDSGEAARLLGTSDADASAAAASGGINYRCHVCHMNYAEEKLARTHAAIGIGCQKCHGPCNEHCSDEDNITPPTILFPRAKIVPSCMKCHADDKLADMDKHKPALTAARKWQKVCTDCHGTHRLEVRTRRWNKETRELIFDDGVRMIRQPKPR